MSYPSRFGSPAIMGYQEIIQGLESRWDPSWDARMWDESDKAEAEAVTVLSPGRTYGT
jgi:hypothetical protein